LRAVRAVRPLAGSRRSQRRVVVGAAGDEGAEADHRRLARRSGCGAGGCGLRPLDRPDGDELAPVAAQGTDLLGSAWGDHVREQILGFLRDYFFDPPM
jgi:hypothetical protein